MPEDPSSEFAAEDVERAARYHRPLYLALAVDLLLGAGTLAALAFWPPARRLFRLGSGLPFWARGLLVPAITVAAAELIRLPVSFWRGFVHERRWGFSTQSLRGWLSDRAKGSAIGVVLTSAVLLGLSSLARGLPRTWPLVAAPAAALIVLFMSFVAPLILEPVFNRFAVLDDDALHADLRALADRAGVPVREVLVADASRRTRKENAYVSGLGRTRRIVVYDTLLARGDPREVRVVVAHELGHRRMRHVAKGTALGMAGTALAVAVLWMLVRSDAVLSAIGATSAGDPRAAPFVLLMGVGLEVVALPFGAARSRRWESAADRFSLEQTGDLDGFVATHRALARANLIDLAPPRALYVLLFSHPTPPERIAAARRWGPASTERRGPTPSGPHPATRSGPNPATTA